jgi:hypothetical protein
MQCLHITSNKFLLFLIYCINYTYTNLLFQTGLRCMDCGYSCHEKCVEGAPKNCSKFKAGAGQDGTLNSTTLTRSGADSGSVSSSKY